MASSTRVATFPSPPTILLLLLFCSSICPFTVADSFRAQLFPRLAIQQNEQVATLQPKLTPSKCQKDYLEAMVHRCRVGDRVCFADDLELEDVQELAGYVSEMCCLLRCQPKTLERLCCRNQQGKCRKAKCLNVEELGVIIEGAGETSRK